MRKIKREVRMACKVIKAQRRGELFEKSAHAFISMETTVFVFVVPSVQ